MWRNHHPGTTTTVSLVPDTKTVDEAAERGRVATFGQLADGLLEAGDWYRWGPYLSERQWGTVREDYSADGDAWAYFPHDHARSRAYRWGEDGMAGFSDIEQRFCLGLALWNGNDAILKERMFGLTGAQGNHGEDAKDYWWYLDALPSHAWNRWRYHYPQRAFPYDDLVAENARRDKHQPEYELLDTGAFDDDRYWVVEVDYAKAGPDDIVMVVRATNVGPDAATLHVLPTAWFRNTWSWDVGAEKPELRLRDDGAVVIDHPVVGPMELVAEAGPDGSRTDAAVLRERDERAAAVRIRHGHTVPQGRGQRPRGARRAVGQSGPHRHEGLDVVPARGGPGSHDRGSSPTAPHRRDGRSDGGGRCRSSPDANTRRTSSTRR